MMFLTMSILAMTIIYEIIILLLLHYLPIGIIIVTVLLTIPCVH